MVWVYIAESFVVSISKQGVVLEVERCYLLSLAESRIVNYEIKLHVDRYRTEQENVI